MSRYLGLPIDIHLHVSLALTSTRERRVCAFGKRHQAYSDRDTQASRMCICICIDVLGERETSAPQSSRGRPFCGDSCRQETPLPFPLLPGAIFACPPGPSRMPLDRHGHVHTPCGGLCSETFSREMRSTLKTGRGSLSVEICRDGRRRRTEGKKAESNKMKTQKRERQREQRVMELKRKKGSRCERPRRRGGAQGYVKEDE